MKNHGWNKSVLVFGLIVILLGWLLMAVRYYLQGDVTGAAIYLVTAVALGIVIKFNLTHML